MIHTPKEVVVLSVGPMDEHQDVLHHILQDAALPGHPPRGASIEFCSEANALAVLRNQRIPILLCDQDSGWRQLLEAFRVLPDPPLLIVTARLADDRLWCEALNLGAYDVLSKPFNAAEVTRVLAMAWTGWVARSAKPQPLQNASIQHFLYA